MSDILGVGRVVDEASEVLDSLDRPIWSINSVEKIGRKTTTHNLSISKLDIGFLLIIGSIILMAIEHRTRTGESMAEFIMGYSVIGAIKDRIVASGMLQTADNETTANIIKETRDNSVLTVLSPIGGLLKTAGVV